MAEGASVYELWSKVMDEVQSISKDSRNTQQNFNFRGIDAVLNTVGPVLRKHGVLVVPKAITEDAERYTTAKGGQMINRTVKILFTVYGPNGDSFDGSAYGEAADAGDKAMSKAQSVAYRTFLLQALTIPTDDADPDSSSHERESVRVRQPAQEAPKTPADVARDELREIAANKGWDLAHVAATFVTRFTPDGAKSPADLRTASAVDVRAFTNLLLEGVVTL